MMPPLPRTPHDVPAAFAERFNTGDAAAVVEMFEPDAVLVPSPGTPVRHGALPEALQAHLSLNVPITVEARHVYESGDVALLIVDWRIEGRDPQGDPVSIAGTATDVARRGADGFWRYVVDNPNGTA